MPSKPPANAPSPASPEPTPAARRAVAQRLAKTVSTKSKILKRIESEEPLDLSVTAEDEHKDTAVDPEEELRRDMGVFSKDPLGFVLYAFPWGTGELEKFDGPDSWQREILEDLGRGLITVDQAIRLATASGHGIGKSALVAWIIYWGMSTFEDCRGLVTANTETQLKSKTWAELAKWHRLAITRHWFVFTATALYSADEAHEKTWRFDMIPWSENKTEAFAGMHNKGKRLIVIMDEASAIPDVIWEVTEGALTDSDTEIIWAVFGNPTRNTGRFHACFHEFRHRWVGRQIDSRSVAITNKKQIQEWVDDFGEDSDFVRVRVRGIFPSSSDHQFISVSVVESAMKRSLIAGQYHFAAKILCLDNAWTGGDEIVIGLRQGLMSKICATFKKNDDDLFIAGQLARIEDEEQADAVFIDLGYGTGVYSAGKNMNREWTLIAFGGASPDPGFVNMRAYMWNQMKKWLAEGGVIPNDPILKADLIGPEAYVVMTGRNAGKIYLESKEQMKDRGLPSPNRADQLALSFAAPVMPKNRNGMPIRPVVHEYDPYAPKPIVSQSRIAAYDPYLNQLRMAA